MQGQETLIALQSAENPAARTKSSRGTLGKLGWVLIGVQNTYPNETLRWLNRSYRMRLELAKKAQAQACYGSMEAMATDLDVEQIVNLANDATAMQALRVIGIIDDLSAVGGEKSRQPVLIAQGLADVSAFPEVVEYAYNVTCDAGSTVYLQLYPGLDYDSIIPAFVPSFLQ